MPRRLPSILEEVPITLWSMVSLAKEGLIYAFAKPATIGASGVPVVLSQDGWGAKADYLVALQVIDVRVPAKAVIGPETSLLTMAWLELSGRKFGEAPVAAMPVTFAYSGKVTVPAQQPFLVGLHVKAPADAEALVILRGVAGRPV